MFNPVAQRQYQEGLRAIQKNNELLEKKAKAEAEAAKKYPSGSHTSHTCYIETSKDPNEDLLHENQFLRQEVNNLRAKESALMAEKGKLMKEKIEKKSASELKMQSLIHRLERLEEREEHRQKEYHLETCYDALAKEKSGELASSSQNQQVLPTPPASGNEDASRDNEGGSSGVNAPQVNDESVVVNGFVLLKLVMEVVNGFASLKLMMRPVIVVFMPLKII